MYFDEKAVQHFVRNETSLFIYGNGSRKKEEEEMQACSCGKSEERRAGICRSNVSYTHTGEESDDLMECGEDEGN